MDGLLVVDKPAGPSSHDIVAWARRILGERRIGHTGTLDPAATGVLPLVLGRATRLARFLSGSDKSYDAVVRLGVATDTDDAQGTAMGPAYEGELPARELVELALSAFRGTFLQQPPAHSAKKIAGHRSYALARRRSRTPIDAVASDDAGFPAPVSVTAHSIEILGMDGDTLRLRVDCSAGFYIRALARDLGAQLGIGAHLSALRRTRSGHLTIDSALSLDAIDRNPGEAIRAIVPLSGMLPDLTSVTLTSDGVRHAGHGRMLVADDLAAGRAPAQGWLRLVDSAGNLVAIGRQHDASGVLHPSVVLR